MKIANKITYTLAIFLTVIFFIFPSFLCGGAVARAATVANTPYEKQNVLIDLQGSLIDGEPFRLDSFAFDESKETRVLSFIEYGYSFYAEKQGDYGLYVYVYNPQGKDFVVDSRLNKIQLSYAGNEDYEKYPLTFLNQSEQSGYEGLFLKYRIELTDEQKADMLKLLNSTARIYNVSGIELLTSGKYVADEYSVRCTYEYSGYSMGYGTALQKESSLVCNLKEGLETVSFDVNHTFYRTKTSSKGAPYYNARYQVQLDTVYFAIPKKYLDDFGKLQRIKAEWYEYKTKEILVTSNKDFYDHALPYMGVEFEPYYVSDYMCGTVYNSNVGYSLAVNPGETGNAYAASWGWNLGTGYFQADVAQALYYMFYTSDISNYDPYAEVSKNGGVTSNELYDYIKGYKKTFESGTVKGGLLSADLFEDDIDENRKIDNERGKIQQGYSYYDFDVDTDLQEIKGYKSNNNDLSSNMRMYGFWQGLFGTYTDVEDIDLSLSPIYILSDDDVKGTSAADRQRIADNLCINYSDVESLQEFYNDAVTVSGQGDEEKVVVLFRFATSDYLTANVDIVQLGAGFLGRDKYTSGQAYFAQQSVFFDFDIIQLTFKKGNKLTAIPVITSPLDIVDDITPPPVVDNGKDLWKIIVAIILFIVVLIVFFRFIWPLLKPLLKGLWDIVTAPFKAISNAIKKRK